MTRIRTLKTVIAAICSLALILGFLPTAVFSTAGTAFAESSGASVSEVVYQLSFTSGTDDEGYSDEKRVENPIYPTSDNIKGISFNKETNTLTLDNVSAKGKLLAIASSTNDFTINVKGANKLAGIDYSNCFGSTLKITGNGTLSLTIDGNVSREGITVSPGRLIVEPTVTLNIDIAEDADMDSTELIDAQVFSVQKATGLLTVGGQLTPSNLKITKGTFSEKIWAYWIDDDSENTSGILCKKNGRYYVSAPTYSSTSDEYEDAWTGYDVYPVTSSLSTLDTDFLWMNNIEVEVGAPTHIDAVAGEDDDWLSQYVPAGYESVTVNYYHEFIEGASLTNNGTAKTKVKTVTINASTVTASAVDKAVKKLNTSKKTASAKTVTSIVLGTKVKGISAKAFAKYAKAKTLTVKTKNLTKKSVKGSLTGSNVATVKVNVSSKAATNKKYAKTYKAYFAKANSGKKVTVKAA